MTKFWIHSSIMEINNDYENIDMFAESSIMYFVGKNKLLNAWYIKKLSGGISNWNSFQNV